VFRFGHDELKLLDEAQALLRLFLPDMFRRRLRTLDAGGEGVGQAALDGSYETLALETAGGYRALGLAPVVQFGAAVTAEACQLTPQGAERLLEELAEANLVEELGADRYRFHALVERVRRDGEYDLDPEIGLQQRQRG
jgi:hypothetical protein